MPEERGQISHPGRTSWTSADAASFAESALQASGLHHELTRGALAPWVPERQPFGSADALLAGRGSIPIASDSKEKWSVDAGVTMQFGRAESPAS